MAGLLDAFLNMTPEQNKGLLAAATKMLDMSAPSRVPRNIMQVAAHGMNAFDSGVRDAQQQKMEDQFYGLKLQDAEADFKHQQTGRARSGRISDRIAGLGGLGDSLGPLLGPHLGGGAGAGGAGTRTVAGYDTSYNGTPYTQSEAQAAMSSATGMVGYEPDKLNQLMALTRQGMSPGQAASIVFGGGGSKSPGAQQDPNSMSPQAPARPQGMPEVGSDEWMQGIQQQAGQRNGQQAGSQQPAAPSFGGGLTADTNSPQFWLQSAMPGQMTRAAQPNGAGKRPNQTQAWVQRLMTEAQIFAEEGDHAGAAARLDLVQKFRPNATWKEVRQGGKVVNMPFFDDGQPGEASDAEVAAKLHWEDTGPSTLGLDAYDGSVKAQIKNGMTPDGVASNAVARDTLALSRARFGLDQRKFAQEAQGAGGQKAPPGYRWSANGSSLEAIPGGPATLKANATEGERKAATLLMRLDGSEKQLQAALKDDPGASTPSLLTQGLRSMGAEATANTVTGSGRQRVEAAQLDMLDAALTLGTGAAYTREQLEGYRKSYFPQIGDSDDTVADKKARLKNVIGAAKVAAGRAAPKAEEIEQKPVISLADITETARRSKRTTREVTAAFRAKGYKIQGDK